MLTLHSSSIWHWSIQFKIWQYEYIRLQQVSKNISWTESFVLNAITWFHCVLCFSSPLIFYSVTSRSIFTTCAQCNYLTSICKSFSSKSGKSWSFKSLDTGSHVFTTTGEQKINIAYLHTFTSILYVSVCCTSFSQESRSEPQRSIQEINRRNQLSRQIKQTQMNGWEVWSGTAVVEEKGDSLAPPSGREEYCQSILPICPTPPTQTGAPGHTCVYCSRLPIL